METNQPSNTNQNNTYNNRPVRRRLMSQFNKADPGYSSDQEVPDILFIQKKLNN